MQQNQPIVIYIMGVSGSGKTTIGLHLAEETGLPFYDGDDFHSAYNRNKMASGKPLTDKDRYSWLEAIRRHVVDQLKTNSCIIACSSLKDRYRQMLAEGIEAQTKWVFLHGSYNLILERMGKRTKHFMPTALLKSQFETLESPRDALKIDIQHTPNDIVSQIKQAYICPCEFGVIGLGIMGKSLCRNVASKGIRLAMYNRHVPITEENVAINFKNKHKELASTKAFDDLKAFVNSLQSPKKILLMVNAGTTIDRILNDLTPLLSQDDIIIDGGNSHYADTERRIQYLEEKQIHFIGCGISGGEEGALKGPSIMPGGKKDAYKKIENYLTKMAASDKDGKPCCTYIGKGGSGHFVKTIHNGIEYVEMQLLAEVYHIYQKMGKTASEIAAILCLWKSEVNSFLLEITIQILTNFEKDDFLINKILDKAENKGTGNWATIAAAELGVPATLIASSLFARYISSLKDERILLSKAYQKKELNIKLDDNIILQAYKLARIINHHQGFQLLKEASNTFEYQLNLSEIARIWTNGCIIRSDLMETLVPILKGNKNILINKDIKLCITENKDDLTKLIIESISNELTIPCFSDALNYFNGITEENLPANLIQAQRDFFGAHTYQRNDDDSENYYHSNWK
jgi:6-phosphogluconate dehydrogenase